MKDLLAKNFENFWKNVLRKILRTFVFGKYIVDPPPPGRQYFSGKIFGFRKNFF
jgi:hypothetical protein